MKISFSVDCDIAPAPRPRLGKFGAYMPKAYQDLKSVIKDAAKAAMAGTAPLANKISAQVEFRRKWKITSRRFGDVDNLMKTVFDSCNKIIFNDDSQIVEVVAKKVQSEVAGADVTFISECD
jgi:Holliday junction resolvase RusA-like endonuclease